MLRPILNIEVPPPTQPQHAHVFRILATLVCCRCCVLEMLPFNRPFGDQHATKVVSEDVRQGLRGTRHHAASAPLSIRARSRGVFLSICLSHHSMASSMLCKYLMQRTYDCPPFLGVMPHEINAVENITWNTMAMNRASRSSCTAKK